MDHFGNKCKVARNEVLGRYVIAAKDMSAGETVLVENPVIVMPSGNEKRCANCFKIAGYICRDCHVFPLCDHCTQHNSFECGFFIQMKNIQKDFLVKHPEACGPLKCLLLRENPETEELFNHLMLLESHQSERRGSDIWLQHSKKVIEPLLNSGIAKYFLRTGTTHLNEELLQTICGIINVNSFEIRAPDQTDSMSAVYLRASLFAHQCVANTSIAIDDSNQMKIYANRDVKEGEMLHYCYTNPLLGTDERRHLLKVSKYFHCNCQRCEDPTELDSHMNSILCPGLCASDKSAEGFIISKGAIWHCQTCDLTMDSIDVERIVERAKEEIFLAKNDVRKYELLIAKFTRIFHPNHYLIIDLKQNVAAILRSILMNLTCRPGRQVFERKVQLCEDILSVLRIVQPGISRLKAIALYEMFTAFIELSRLRFGENEITDVQLLEQLYEAEAMLKESIRMLLFEPVNTPEGQLTRSMLKELKDIQTDIKSVTIEQNKQIQSTFSGSKKYFNDVITMFKCF